MTATIIDLAAERERRRQPPPVAEVARDAQANPIPKHVRAALLRLGFTEQEVGWK